MNDTRPVVLLLHEVMAVIKPVLEPAYEVVCLWDYPDFDALVAARGADVRVIATHGGLGLDPAIVEALPRLGLIVAAGAGYDGIDVAHARARGIEVVNGAGSNAGDVADLALALVLATVCDLKAREARLHEGRWTETDRGPERWSLKQRRVGIVGLGWIGRAVAERLVPFGCPISWFGPNPKPDAPWPRTESLEALAADSDILIVAAPLIDATEHLIGRGIIEALGPRGLLVNVARGGLVDEDALIAALKAGTLGWAALDVQEQEPTPPARWAGVPNIILTPHIGGYASGGMATLGELLIENLRRFFAGEPLLTPVYAPKAQPRPWTASR